MFRNFFRTNIRQLNHSKSFIRQSSHINSILRKSSYLSQPIQKPPIRFLNTMRTITHNNKKQSDSKIEIIYFTGAVIAGFLTFLYGSDAIDNVDLIFISTAVALTWPLQILILFLYMLFDSVQK